MPAIPVLARLEAHMTDDELQALRDFLGYSIVMHVGGRARPFDAATGGHEMQSATLLRGAQAVHQAAERAIAERQGYA